MRTNERLRWLVAVAFVAGCGGDGENTTPITIGAVLDQSSTTAWGSWPTAGRLALSQINTALEKVDNPVRFKLSVLDNQNSNDVALQQAKAKELADQGAKGVITDTSFAGIALTRMMYDDDGDNDINVPILCVTCTAPAMNSPTATDADPIRQLTLRDEAGWNFRTVHRATEQTRVLADVIASQGDAGDVNEDGVFKVTAVILPDASGHGFAFGLPSLFPGAIVEKVVVDAADHDPNDTAYFDSIVAKMLDDDSDCPQDLTTASACADAVANDGYADAFMENLNPSLNIALSEALSRAANTTSFFHAHAFRATQIANILRAKIDGQYGVSANLFANSAAGQAFKNSLLDSSGLGPTLLDSSMYDAAALNALAVLKAGRDLADPSAVTGEAVRAALLELNDPEGTLVSGADFGKAIELIKKGEAINYDGASGPVDFDAEGNVVMRLALYQGDNGVFVDRAFFDCVTNLATCPIGSSTVA